MGPVAVSKKTWLLLIAVPPFLLGLFVVGLFVYVNATARPLHPYPWPGLAGMARCGPSFQMLFLNASLKPLALAQRPPQITNDVNHIRETT